MADRIIGMRTAIVAALRNAGVCVCAQSEEFVDFLMSQGLYLVSNPFQIRFISELVPH